MATGTYHARDRELNLYCCAPVDTNIRIATIGACRIAHGPFRMDIVERYKLRATRSAIDIIERECSRAVSDISDNRNRRVDRSSICPSRECVGRGSRVVISE